MRRAHNQQTIFNIFDKIKHNLTQNNSININNLHNQNVYFELICKYAKQGFKILTETIHRQKQIILELTHIIKKQGLQNNMEHIAIDLQQNTELSELNQSITQFLAAKSDNLNGSEYLQSNTNRYNMMERSKVTNQNTNKSSLQQNLFSKFINNLKYRLEYAFQIGSQIPKQILLTNFIKFCKQNNCKIDSRHYNNLQMALNNFIKIHFPKSTQTHSSFRGIKFKSQHNNLSTSHISHTKHQYPQQNN